MKKRILFGIFGFVWKIIKSLFWLIGFFLVAFANGLNEMKSEWEGDGDWVYSGNGGRGRRSHLDDGLDGMDSMNAIRDTSDPLDPLNCFPHNATGPGCFGESSFSSSHFDSHGTGMF